jgi:UDP-glucose 4-epimerase
MKAIVTGGAGFIGSHLCERLLGDGHSVAVIDNLATGRRENLRFAEGSPRFELHVLDVRETAAVSQVAHGADWLFHLAGLADIVPSIEKPEDYFEANVRGTLSVLEAARRSEVRRFVYAASSSCYGVPSASPTPESAPAAPEYPYALTKYQGEQLVLHWAKVYRLPALSLRLFNVFGPKSRTTGAYGAVFGVFLAQKLAGKPLTVVGDGTQTRDFTYVTDVVDAFVRAAASELSGEALNVGTGRPQSINRLVQLIGGEYVCIPKRPGEPDQTCADVSKTARLLGWRAQTPFEVGVAALLDRLEDTRAWFERLSPALG